MRRTGSKRRPRPGSAGGSPRPARLAGRDAERARGVRRSAASRALADIDRLGALELGELEPRWGRVRLTAGALAPVLDALLALAAALRSPGAGIKGVSDDADAVGRRAITVADDLDACLTLDDPDRVSWAEPSAPAGARRRLGDPAGRPLGAPGDGRARLGDPRTDASPPATRVRGRSGSGRGSPFDYPDAGAPLRAARSPRAARTSANDRIAEEVTALCAVSPAGGRSSSPRPTGRSTPSWSALRHGFYPILCQGDAPRERCAGAVQGAGRLGLLFVTATSSGEAGRESGSRSP